MPRGNTGKPLVAPKWVCDSGGVNCLYALADVATDAIVTRDGQ